MWFGVRVVALLLIALLLGLTPAAYCDPPDPLWISGYWDDDDADNAVVAIVDACALPAALPPASEPPWTFVARLELPRLNLAPGPVCYSVGPRAPPVAALLAS